MILHVPRLAGGSTGAEAAAGCSSSSGSGLRPANGTVGARQQQQQQQQQCSPLARLAGAAWLLVPVGWLLLEVGVSAAPQVEYDSQWPGCLAGSYCLQLRWALQHWEGQQEEVAACQDDTRLVNSSCDGVMLV